MDSKGERLEDIDYRLSCENCIHNHNGKKGELPGALINFAPGTFLIIVYCGKVNTVVLRHKLCPSKEEKGENDA